MIVTLYTKADCGLCEEAASMLKRLQRQTHFEIEYVNIEADARANELYGSRIPVIAVDGEEVAAAPLDEKRVTAILLR
ncbi:MAG: glutaredoxin family protein [Chloroflexi bacterium]|nr:glutaredoxin family protein [Chloroflexota bacterium]MCH7953577.1 glutaredoxin family protein [Chloroflexota bacterium]MCI0784659.1 glutaredoxin family protein [Chloroflexota bacterium]MCI0814525.1 glutaredoxin family protein [Chloroflexota bacterium]MCI0817561.1 glutaredoxin family protein [Chloroflexota bacterium]